MGKRIFDIACHWHSNETVTRRKNMLSNMKISENEWSKLEENLRTMALQNWSRQLAYHQIYQFTLILHGVMDQLR